MNCSLCMCLLSTISLGAFIFLLFCIILKFTTKPYPYVYRSKKEQYFTDPSSGQSILFPSLNDPSTINLSVIVPAYNEETRLPPMLDECIDYLEKKSKPKNYKYEIIIVSDGSTDRTVAVAHEYAKKISDDKIRVLALETNRGKGGAVRLGMQSARGALVLFADADGATTFSDLSKLETNITESLKSDYCEQPEVVAEKLAIVIGSRAHLEDIAIATRSYFRTLLMFGFHFLVWCFAVQNIRDTQCGFKLFTRQAARLCFSSMHIEKWAFDVELIYIAQRLNIPISEVSVKWTEIDGSKVSPFWSALQMAKDLAFIWLRYKIRAWKIITDKSK